MAIFKCKMCGGTLEINTGDSVAVCEYCNTKQTLPRLDDEKRTQLYDRANYFRRENEFDKAMGIYEMILSEDKEDCESYWGIVLCRYGIEYVEDPRSHKRIPTVNRAQFTSVFDDEDYKNAIKYADALQKEVYEAEANTIDKIQRGILAISQKEEPFDIFICYKETDSLGNRTQDSVYAQDIYTALIKEGYKVFFSKITLEDKLGSAYEPYIFAALNTAKVMLVVGTSKDNFNAVWVKNEWSRYLGLIKQGKEKTLIPVYKDITPYDMPEEFQYLQSQDMGKIGFRQDLLRGISKLIDVNKTTVKETVVVNSGNAQAEPLLKRAFMFLEDGDFARADQFCEQVLNIDPENARAYLGKLMVEMRVIKAEQISTSPQPLKIYKNFEKAVRFADQQLKTVLLQYAEQVQYNLDLKVYNRALAIINGKSPTESDYIEAAKIFNTISNFKEAKEKELLCYEKIDGIKKDAILKKAKSTISVEYISNYELAINLLETIPGWKDADEILTLCKEKIEKLQHRQKIVKKISLFVVSIIAVIIILIITLNAIISAFIVPANKYNDALKLMDEGKYIEAYEQFVALGDYKDSQEKASSIYGEYQKDKLKYAQVGDCIFFGSYEQDNNTSNGKEEIEWIVLDKQDDKILVISKYAIDCQPYNEEYEDVTWETCTLRSWLNNDFVNSAFSDEEKALIPTVTVTADSGKDTQDKVFLLSIDETNTYFSFNHERKCQPTAFTVSNGAYESVYGCCYWWLRSPGDEQESAVYIRTEGDFLTYGSYVDYNGVGVRPAMWIEIE